MPLPVPVICSGVARQYTCIPGRPVSTVGSVRANSGYSGRPAVVGFHIVEISAHQTARNIAQDNRHTVLLVIAKPALDLRQIWQLRLIWFPAPASRQFRTGSNRNDRPAASEVIERRLQNRVIHASYLFELFPNKSPIDSQRLPVRLSALPPPLIPPKCKNVTLRRRDLACFFPFSRSSFFTFSVGFNLRFVC